MTNIPDESRAAARKRLEERRGFVPHLIVYLVVNAGLVLLWVMTGADGLFWPIFPLMFWGVGLVMHGWNAFVSRPITDADIDRELDRQRGEPRTP
jgi:hypothetical protein